MNVRQIVSRSGQALAVSFSRAPTASVSQPTSARQVKQTSNPTSFLLKLAATSLLTASGTAAYCDGALSPTTATEDTSSFSGILDFGTTASATDLSASSSSAYTNPLLQRVANADPQAVRTLAHLVNDSSQHPALLDDAALSALSDGLAAARSSGPSTRPVQLALLRLMADLAQNNPQHPQFSNSLLSQSLSPVLSDIAASTMEPSIHWIRRKLSLLPSPVPPSDSSPNPYSETAQIDLDAGIAYHALRCVANIARHSHIHSHILETPLLQHVCRLLIHLHNFPAFSQPGSSLHSSDILRFTTIAVSALAKSAQKEVVSSGAHYPIIEQMSQHEDPILQSYAAGGVRNLSRHLPNKLTNSWYVHRELVVSNVSQALAEAMDPQSSPQTRAFAAISFADIMTTKHPKAHIIRARLKVAYQSYSNLMKETNAVVSRALCRSLTMLFDDRSDGQKAAPISSELASLVAERSGTLVNIAFKRHDLLALRALRAMSLNEIVAQNLIDKGALEYLTSEMLKASGDYLEECMATLACLSEWPDHHMLISQRGALRAVLRRPCLADDGRWATTFLANMARNEEHHVDIAHSGLRILLTAVTSKKDDVVRQGARALYNLSLGGVSKVMVSQGGTIVPLVKAIRSSDSDARRFAIGAIAEISEAPELSIKLVEADIIGVLLKSAKEDKNVQRDVARCLAQLSQVSEVHGSLSKSGAASWLAEMVSINGGQGEHAGEVMQYATIGVCNIAYSPGITRDGLLEKGIVPTLVALVSASMSDQIARIAKQALQNLRGKECQILLTEGTTKNSRPA